MAMVKGESRCEYLSLKMIRCSRRIDRGPRTGGATVDPVATCDDAFAAIATRTLDAIVLDLMLPDGSGLDVVAGIRKTGDKTPVLLLTALDQVGDRITGLDAGADDYVGKPFDLDELAARLRAVARRQSGRAAARLARTECVLDPAALTATAKATYRSS